MSRKQILNLICLTSPAAMYEKNACHDVFELFTTPIFLKCRQVKPSLAKFSHGKKSFAKVCKVWENLAFFSQV